MADGINAKYTNFIAHTAELDTKPLKNKQEAEEAKTGGGRSIWNIYAAQDANQNEYITKQESSEISDWKAKDTRNAQTLLNNAINTALTNFDNAIVKNNIFTKLSGEYIEKFAQVATDILNKFQGLNVGSKQIEINVKSETEASDINNLSDQTNVQTEINNIAKQGINNVVANFENTYNQNISNILIEAQTKALEALNVNNDTKDKNAEYGKPKTREVNGTPTDVYKKDGKHYIKNNDQFEEVFLVNDNGKNKYVTYDVKAQLGLQGKEGDISTKKVEVNGMDGEQNLIRNEGEKVGGHKTYSDTDGNQYIRSNNEYFAMGSDEGVLLQNGGHAVHETNEQTGETTLVGIKYKGKTYAINSPELKAAAKEIQENNAETEKTRLDGLDNDDKATRNASGIYRAGDISQTQAKEMVTPIYNDAIELLSGRDSETTAKWTKTFDEAFKKDIQETFNKNELSTTNLDKATDDFRMEHPIKLEAVTVYQPQFNKENAPTRDNPLAREEITTANDVIKNKWGGQNKENNAIIQAAIKENSGITGSYGVINAALDKLGIDFETIDFKAFSKDLIAANPSIFDNEGQLYANANISKLDFPTKEVIEAKYGKKEDQAPVQSAPAQTQTTTPLETTITPTPIGKPKPKTISEDAARKMITDTTTYKDIKSFMANLTDTKMLKDDVNKEKVDNALQRDIKATAKSGKLSLDNLNEYYKLVNNMKKLDPKTVAYKTTMKYETKTYTSQRRTPQNTIETDKTTSHIYTVSFKNIKGQQIQKSYSINNPTIFRTQDGMKKEALEKLNQQIKQQGYKYVEITT